MVVMEHLGFDIELPTQHCCGLPMIGSGDMDGAKKLAKENIALLKPWTDKGYDILTSCTSCSMMLKHEYDEVLKIDGAEAINEMVCDLGQYLRQLLENKEISFHLHPVAGNAAYHTPCHLKAQKIGLPFIDILKAIPTFKVDVMNAPCCGQSGSYGLKKEKYDVSQKVSRTLTSSLTELDPDIALSECGPCQVRMHGVSGLPVAHPVSILRKALDPDWNEK
jgi:glycerol-3-phosphate dehydrogenase subunit C